MTHLLHVLDHFLPGLATGVCITVLAAIWALRSDRGSALPKEGDPQWR